MYYNNFIVDTYIVGKYIGSNALAAVGSSYTLMIFLTSIIIGLCMGSGIFNVFWS
ncbi:MATE family efflux transporter [Faecalibacillus intestinalis]|uniref:MATE family efflux transporter n=1 Tax=Faecalibacillus intestinalis TaxID=1982626 RepID=UPI002AA50ADE